MYRQCDITLDLTKLYLFKEDRVLLHMQFPWVSIEADAPPHKQLKYYREYRGLLMRELAKQIDVSMQTIMNYENQHMPIGYDNANKIAKILNIEATLLYDDYCKYLDYPFNKRLQELRGKLGITQFELADAIGVARGSYGTWECASVRPGREPFIKTRDYFKSIGIDLLSKDGD